MSQAGMEVASHNIANVNTPGYSRQRLNLETTPAWKNESGKQMGTGVSALNISRYHDDFLTRSIVTKSSQYASAAAQKSAVDSLESFFNESDGNGVNAALSEFFALWDSVADAAELDPSREELVNAAKTLAETLAMRRQDLDAIRGDLNARVESAVKDINGILDSIAKLNQQIMVDEDGSRRQQANDLRDSRDALLIQLAEYIDIDYYEDPTNGAVNISFASGPALVMNSSAYSIGAELDEADNIRIIANHRRSQPPWPEDVTQRIGGGMVGGWIEFRDETMRDFYLQYESFADQLMFQINNQHAQGVGLDLYRDSTGTSLVSNQPSYIFAFDGDNNDLKITANTNHLEIKEPYQAVSDPENIAVRFVKSDKVSNSISSSVAWNDDPEVRKWEITITLPVDSNGNVTATAEDVIRHINSERSQASGAVDTLPPRTLSGQYKVGDFISAQAAPLNNWTGNVNFSASSFPSGDGEFAGLNRSLANVMEQGRHLSYGSEYASLTTALKHTDNDLIFTAVNAGRDGEKIAVEYVTPVDASGALAPNRPLSVSVYTDIDGTKRLSVSLATDEKGVISTAADVKALINSDPATRDLIYAQTAEGQTGQGLVGDLEPAYLDRSGGFDLVTYDADGQPTFYRITVDPTDTLQDVVSRIGLDFESGVKGVRAEVLTDQNGKSAIRLIADSGLEYGFANDSSGALAVLGLNNIFTGDSTNNIGVNQQLLDNPRLLAAGRLDADGARADGDGTNALDLNNLKDKRFSFYKLSSATLDTAFNTFYADIGATNRAITTGHDYLYTVLDDMHSRQDALAGVNLDEELADILRYQYMYQASAKMISTIDSLMETLLAIR
jgi:flagellar hook-associated protein FlgK